MFNISKDAGYIIVEFQLRIILGLLCVVLVASVALSFDGLKHQQQLELKFYSYTTNTPTSQHGLV